MFHSLLPLVTRRPAATGPEIVFVEDVRLVRRSRTRNRRAERLLLVCWILIAAKCWLVTWLVQRYHMNFSALWVTAPTVIFALVCTGVYFGRD